MEFGGAEYMIRGRGYLDDPRELEEAVVAGGGSSQIVRVKDVGKVTMGPEMRRGVADLDGGGETVSGIVIMRQGANVVDVIDRVKGKLKEIAPGLPAGVRVVPVYDRSELVHRVIDNLRSTLIEIILTVVAGDPPVPVASAKRGDPHRDDSADGTCGGRAVPSHGAFVQRDVAGGNRHRGRRAGGRGHRGGGADPQETGGVADGRRPGDADSVILSAVKEVGRPAFFALLIMAIAFLPVLALEGQEGRLFHPLAYAKSLTMLTAALLTITLDPALRLTLAGLGRRDGGGNGGAA